MDRIVSVSRATAAGAVPRRERRALWIAVGGLCLIAVAVSVRRLVALAGPPSSGASLAAVLDGFFAAKPGLTRLHIIPGLVFALAIPFQLWSPFRRPYRVAHRWVGRVLVIVGVVTGVTGYAMAASPVGGIVETAAIVLYATLFLAALIVAFRSIRVRRVAAHREWMLRATGILLGIAATRPVMAVFFASSSRTHLKPEDFFGYAMWIGFTTTTVAAEGYVRWTRRTRA